MLLQPKKLKTPVQTIHFDDHPAFTPNLTPSQIFQLGSFGGTYWRPIYCTVTQQHYHNQHKKYPKQWWDSIPDNWLATPYELYNTNINTYKVSVGTSLEYWQERSWITKYHPYGWVHWYCDFFLGKRCPDDARQIDRWKRASGPNGRFRKRALSLSVAKQRFDYADYPKLHQILQHWAYQITQSDYDTTYKELVNEIKASKN